MSSCREAAAGRPATYIFGSAAPDGLTIGNAGSGMVSSAVLGETGVQYDIDKFIFLGSPYSSTHYFFLTRRETGLTTLEKLRVSPRHCASVRNPSAIPFIISAGSSLGFCLSKIPSLSPAIRLLSAMLLSWPASSTLSLPPMIISCVIPNGYRRTKLISMP